MASSSLASQLSGLRSLNASRLASASALTTHASYLFPPRTAASQDLDTVYSLGETGFNELILEDGVFEKWTGGQALFGPAARSTDRTMLGGEENAALNRTIEEFLELVSPVVLSKSAAKCLEWLVRRFRIHDFNSLAALRVFLPYHQTPQFARMIHILDLSSQPYLSFLQPLQKTTQPLPTSVLLSAMLAPPSSSHSLDLIRFVTQSLTTSSSSKAPQRPQILFWSSTLVQLCTRLSGVTSGAENSMGMASSAKKRKSGASAQAKQDAEQLVLSIILPAAVSAATSNGLGPEAQTAGTLVLCAIGVSFHLSADAAATTISELWHTALGAKPNVRQFQAFLTASAALSTNVGADDVNKLITTSTAESLLRHRGLASELASMSESYDIAPFLAGLFGAFVPLAQSVDERLAESAARALRGLVSLSEQGGGVQSSTLEAFIARVARESSAPIPALLTILAACRQSRPSVWNTALRPFTGPDATPANKTRVNDILSQLISLDMASSGGASSSSSSVEWLKLNSAEPSQRALALEAFMTSITESASSVDSPAIQEALLPRLADDDEAVLKTVYSSNGQLLLNAVTSSDALLKPIEAVTVSSNVSPAVLRAHLDFLLGPFLSRHPKASKRVLRNVLWSRLLTTKSNKKEAVVVRQALLNIDSSSPLGALVKKLNATETDSTDQAIKANKLVVSALAQWINEAESDSHWVSHVSFLFFSLSQVESNPAQASTKALSLLVINEMLALTSGSPRFEMLVRRLLQAAQTSQYVLTATADYSLLGSGVADQAWLAMHERPTKVLGLLFWQGLISAAQSLDLKSSASDEHLLGMSPEDANHHIAFARQLYVLANHYTYDAQASRQLLAALFAQLGENAGSFLAGLCSTAETDEAVTTAALKHLRAFLSAYSTDKTSRMRDFQTLLPTLLIALGHSSVAVRQGVLACQQLIMLMAKEGSASKASSDVEVWGYDGVYGTASEPLKYLDCASTYQFCFELSKHSESLTNDASFVSSLLGGLLTPSKGQDKKEVNFKRSVTAYLLSHVDALPSYKTKLSLLRVLSKVRDLTKLQSLMRLIGDIVAPAQASIPLFNGQLEGEESEEFSALLYEAFDKRSKPVLQDSASGAFSLLIKSISSSQPVACKNAAQGLARVYPVLSPDLRREALESMVNVLAKPDFRAPTEVRQALASIEMDAGVLTLLFAQLRGKISTRLHGVAEAPTAKKSKTSDEDQSVETSAAVLGELLESSLSHPLSANGPLILELFEDLRVVVDLHSSKTINGDYLLHLCMSNLNKLLGSAMPTSDTVQSVRVDTVVNVIKASSNPSTFQQALLLLSMVAGLAPELVLHSAMPIFTFVGSTVLQRDDAFSFTVVERVLQSILPPLVKSLKSRGDASKSSFALLKASRPFLCIFTDSATHVPRHRRQNFFQLLVEVLGAQDYAAAVSMLLVDRSAHKIARQTRGEASSSLQLPLGVFSAQTGPIQLQALNEVWQEVLRLWESKDHDVADMTEQVFLDRLSNINSEHSERQVNAKTQVLALLCFIKAVLASSRGLAGRQTLATSDAAYHSFVESALTMAQCQDDSVAALARDTLEGVMALIPIPLFMGIAEQLVSQVEGRHASSGFQLVAARLSTATKAEREIAANSSSKIIDAARSQLAGNDASSRSAALAAIEVLSASADPQELSALGQTLPVVLTLAKDVALPSGERQKTFSILRSLAGALGPRVIAHLKPLVELSLATVVNAAMPIAIVVRSFETLENLFKSVTTFMDSHLRQVLGAFSKSHLRGSLDERSVTPTGKSLNRLLTTVIKRMPSEKLFACIFDLWSEASNDSTGAESLLAVLTLLNKALSQTDRAGISANYKAVFRFVLQVLDLRRLTKTLALRDVNAVEDSTVRVFVRLVLKLNETTFRPLFLRIYDWAALDLVEESDGELPVNDVGLVARRIALYKISNALSDQLRGLVSHYYSTLLDLTIELLAAFRAREVQNAELWSAVVASIAKSATHDEGTFWNPSRLSKLTPAFIGQLSMRNPELLRNLAGTPGGGGHEEVTRALAPAVAQLAKTVPDEASLKVLNSALLTQLRIDEVPTRVAALDVATAMWSETILAAVLLGLVPETVPHIAELMESDETEVVDGTRAFIAAVERVLGEPLDSYLQ